jgi:hypothetical protein
MRSATVNGLGEFFFEIDADAAAGVIDVSDNPADFG